MVAWGPKKLEKHKKIFWFTHLGRADWPVTAKLAF
jgi:hypothetical protein